MAFNKIACKSSDFRFVFTVPRFLLAALSCSSSRTALADAPFFLG